MSTTCDITIHDFENICRTCLSREDLKPLYEKYSSSMYLADMLMACSTSLTFSETDGYPSKLCTNCINELNQAFSFAKRCERTDAILRKCVTKIKTELPDNLSQSQAVEFIIKKEEQIKPEIVHRTMTQENIEFDEYVKVVQEDIKIEYEEFGEDKEQQDVKVGYNFDETEDVDVKQDETTDAILRKCVTKNKTELPDNLSQSQTVEFEFLGEVTQEDDVNIEFEENVKVEQEDIKMEYEEFGEEFVDVNQDETVSEKSDNQNSRPSCTNYKKMVDSSEEDDDDDDDDDFLPGNVQQRIQAGSKKDGSNKTPRKIKHRMSIRTGLKPHICEVCSKAFSRPSLLKIHQRIHTGEKPHTCEVCNTTFAHIFSLSNHMKIHTGQKPYACEVCSRAFTCKSTLTTHMKKHTGERPHTCVVCRKAFIQKSDLTTHIKIHTGEKPHTCEVCSKAFIKKSDLTIHIRLHTGEKPHTCEVCSKAFTRKHHLTTHMKIHNGERPHTCEVCNETFTHIATLSNHMKIHSGERL